MKGGFMDARNGILNLFKSMSESESNVKDIVRSQDRAYNSELSEIKVHIEEENQVN